MPAAGSAARLSAPSAFRRNSWPRWPPRNARPRNSGWSLLLGPVAESYLRRLADTDRSLTRQVRELLLLIRDYGPEAVAGAVQKAHAAARLRRRLHRQHSAPATNARRDVQPPLRLQQPAVE